MRAFEQAELGRTDFASLPPSDRALGPNPYRLARTADGAYAVGLLRGADSVVLLDPATLAEVARAPAPPSPTALAVAADRIFVGGERSGRIAQYQLKRGDNAIELEPAGSIMTTLTQVRDLAVAGDQLYAVSEADGALAVIEHGTERVQRGLRAPIRVAVAGPYAIVDELYGHALDVWRRDAMERQPARIEHDGPIWAFAARPSPDGLDLVALGVEDHPLDRSGGFFGYIDSFAFLYRLRGHEWERRASPARPVRSAELNLSEHGVVTPKAAAWLDGARLLVTGYGGEAALIIRAGDEDLRAAERLTAPPGIADVLPIAGRIIAADPLLDAWLPLLPSGSPRLLAPAEGGIDREARLGEALAFSTLMAPFDSAEGAHSRFTCETCHFEGAGDGRIHFTGRGQVHATTKPLFGLFNNAPHFTRALDPDLTAVADNEFRVAGAGSGAPSWFPLEVEQHPWLGWIGWSGAIDAETERRALMRFLMRFSHPPNPFAAGRTRLSELERAGAIAFSARCAGCHSARLVASQPASEVPFAEWERLVLSENGPIVWASDGYRKTGIEPYVHELGARTSSLRRIAGKRPYFTNGSCETLECVLDRARIAPQGLLHAGSGVPLPEPEQRALLAFLRLL